MPTNFKEGDCVQLINGYTPSMTVARVFDDLKEVSCTWYDTKTQEMKSQDLPMSVLKHCPKELTEEQKLKIMQEIIPPRNH